MDPGRLRTALAGVPPQAWSQPSTYAETGVHHGYRRVGLVCASQWQEHGGLFDFVWDVLQPVRDAWLSWIDPGGFIVPHRDPGPWFQRWQVPIAANGEWRCGADAFEPHPGAVFAVAHWRPHAVVNRSDSPRIHVVVDRDVRLDIPAEPFETYPIPADMADLIERSSR